ncbi:ATP-binding protein [Caminibacter sp.]
MYKLGHNLFIPSKEVVWNYRTEQNPHLMIIGKSGSGKTFLLRNILRHFALNEKKRINVFVIDFHGDLEIKESQTIEYNKNSPTSAGIGVFEFDYYSKAGGIYNRVDELIKIFENSFFNSMSPLRKALLKKLLLDVYIQKGYNPDDKSTWNKPASQLPTLEDLANLIRNIITILQEMKKNKTSPDFSVAVNQFKELLKNKSNYKNDAELIKAADDIYEMYKKELLEKEKSIEEKLGIKDFGFYTKKNVLNSLESIEIYINSMIESKIFSKNNPVLKKEYNVFRFNLKYLEDDLMLFVANLIIQRIFTKLRMRYEYKQNETSNLNTYIVIDESKLILPNKERNNDLHYINRIVSEARKFGLGIILASQRIAHYSQEMLSNIATKIVLNTDESEQPVVRKKLGIKDGRIFEQIKSKEYGIAYVKNNSIDEVVKLI